MSESVHTNTSLWSKGMKAVIVAQFLSAFGDNALLFATLALLKAQFYPEWSQPILQMVFVGAYILFAPFVGQVADSFAKGRVMMFANGLKLLGAASICFGINPFLGYTLVGVGAAAYSPVVCWLTGMSWLPWPHAHWPTVVRSLPISTFPNWRRRVRGSPGISST